MAINAYMYVLHSYCLVVVDLRLNRKKLLFYFIIINIMINARERERKILSIRKNKNINYYFYMEWIQKNINVSKISKII